MHLPRSSPIEIGFGKGVFVKEFSHYRVRIFKFRVSKVSIPYANTSTVEEDWLKVIPSGSEAVVTESNLIEMVA